MKKYFLFIILAILLNFAAGISFAENEFSIFVLNVGKADAIIMRAGKETYVIDTGTAQSCHVLTGELRRQGITSIDGVFITHADKDHAGGASVLAMSGIEVKNWYTSTFSAKFSQSENPVTIAAKIQGKNPTFLKAGDAIKIDGGTINIVAPYSESGEENDNSLVMLISVSGCSALLTGDMESKEEAELLFNSDVSHVDFLKVAHHGRDDSSSLSFLKKTKPEIAVISTSTSEDERTASSKVIERLDSVGTQTFITEKADAGILVSWRGNSVSAEYINFLEYPVGKADVRITRIEKDSEQIVLHNFSDTPCDISWWQLASSKGNEVLVFPENTVILPDSDYIVTTLSSSHDLLGNYLWPEKNVVHNKHEDSISVFDKYGREIDSAK